MTETLDIHTRSWDGHEKRVKAAMLVDLGPVAITESVTGDSRYPYHLTHKASGYSIEKSGSIPALRWLWEQIKGFTDWAAERVKIDAELKKRMAPILFLLRLAHDAGTEPAAILDAAREVLKNTTESE